MIIRNQGGTNTEKIAPWWTRTRKYTELAHQLSNQDFLGLHQTYDIENCIYQLKTHFKAVLTIPYPQEASVVRQLTLAFLVSMITVMQHIEGEMNQESKIIFNMAMNNKHILADCLKKFNL